MIPGSAILRIARPTDNLAAVTHMYVAGLGFEVLAAFDDHDGFSGSIIGHQGHGYHLEFTQHQGSVVGRAPTLDHLLIFYVPDQGVWERGCDSLVAAGFSPRRSFNRYWDVDGRTFEDIDGYRVVLQNRQWTV